MARKASEHLSPMEMYFVYEYIATKFDRSKAYAKACAAVGRGCTAGTADVQACRMLKRPRVRAAVTKLIEQGLEQVRARGVDVIQELGIIGGSDIRDFCRWDEKGTLQLKKPEELGEYARAIKKIVSDGNGGITFELYDKTASLSLLGKNKQLFVERTDVTSGGEKLSAPRFYIPERRKSE